MFDDCRIVSMDVTPKGYIVLGVVYKSKTGSRVAGALMPSDDFFARFGHKDVTGCQCRAAIVYQDHRARALISDIGGKS